MPSASARNRMAAFVADDWGLSPGVNRGILELREKDVLSGVSLLAGAAHLEDELGALLRLPPAAFSLHLNFTYGRPVADPRRLPRLLGGGDRFLGLRRFALDWLRGAIPAEELALEAVAQLRRLRALGVAASGVEGHHHVHLVPGVCGAVAGALAGEGLEWMRLPADPAHAPSFLLGRWHLAAAGGPSALLRPIETLYLRPADYASREALREKARRAAGRPILVHPAARDDLGGLEFPDPCRGERVRQFRALHDWSDADG